MNNSPLDLVVAALEATRGQWIHSVHAERCLKALAAAEKRCEYCDGTGDVTNGVGEWLGYCCCPAGVALKNAPEKAAPPRLFRNGATVEAYRAAMGWKIAATQARVVNGRLYKALRVAEGSVGDMKALEIVRAAIADAEAAPPPEAADLRSALDTAVRRIEDMLAGDDGQAWDEARKALPALRAAAKSA